MNKSYDAYMCREPKQVFHVPPMDWLQEAKKEKFDAEQAKRRAMDNWSNGLYINSAFSLYK